MGPSWQQTLLPSLIFYALAGIVAFGVAGMIAGLMPLLGWFDKKGNK